MTFWWRRWHEQSRTPAAHAVPWPSAISCTSMWCALPTIASMKTVPSPNESAASRREVLSACSSWSSFSTLRMPRPPPPAAALIISGKPMRSACSRASSIVSTGPLLHGATGTPACSAISLDWILSPELAHDRAGGADEDQAHLLDHVHEGGVLGHEAPAGPDGVGLGGDQGALDALVVEVGAGALAVGVDGGGRAEAVGLVGVADEHRAAFGLGVERDDRDRIVRALGVELTDGVDETHRGLAAIDDGETAKRALGHRGHAWHPRPSRCIPDYMEFLQPPTWREALEVRAAHPDALPIWGGTDVMVEMNFARKRPQALLDLTRVEPLSRWERGGRAVPDRRRESPTRA